MFRPLPLFIAWRYLSTRRSNRFGSFVSAISLLGVALGVATLIIVLSVMNGFEREVVRHLIGMSAHAIVVARAGEIGDWHAALGSVESEPGVAAATPYRRGTAMLTRKGRVNGVVVEGIDPQRETRVTDIGRLVAPATLARLAASEHAVVLGAALARQLGAVAGAELNLVLPRWDAAGRVMAPRYARVTVAGVFKSGMQQYDARLVLTHLDAAGRLFDQPDTISGLRLRLHDASDAPLVAAAIAARLGGDFRAIDWMQYQRNFFLALASQKRMLFVILVLVIAVAAFNISANLIMLVTEKTRDIAILRTFGTQRRHIIGLFLAQGLILGASGALLGVALGAWGAANSQRALEFFERMLDADLLNADVYLLDYLPAQVEAWDVLLVCGCALVLALLATVYPAWRAAAIDPARAIHFD